MPKKMILHLRFLVPLIFVIGFSSIDSTFKISSILYETNTKIKIISIWIEWTAWSQLVYKFGWRTETVNKMYRREKTTQASIYITQFDIIYPLPWKNHFCVNVLLTVVICLYKTVSSGNLIHSRLYLFEGIYPGKM